MRFNVELLLNNDIIPKDKNRIIISLLKHNFSSYDKEYYSKLYEKTPNKIKNFTFSIYMGNCKFLREEIIIPDKKIILNFSTHHIKDGIMFYNSFLENKGSEYSIKNNSIKINRINLSREKPVVDNEAAIPAIIATTSSVTFTTPNSFFTSLTFSSN
jgi:CRISPR-associated endoribonuclease Cas6